MLTKVYDIAFEIDGDNIELEQDFGCGEVNRVTLHRIHLRMLAEQAGLLAPSADLEANRLIALLRRRLLILADRIDRLDTMILRIGERGHEDVSEECAFSGACYELAQEFVIDLDAIDKSSNDAETLAPSPGAKPTTLVHLGQRQLGARNAKERHETQKAATGNAERQRRYRERKRNGVTPVTRDGSNAPLSAVSTAQEVLHGME